MDWSKSVFTTGEIAKVMCVARATVNGWCDSGKLSSYKLPTNVRQPHRRVTKVALMEFCKKRGVPIEELLGA